MVAALSWADVPDGMAPSVARVLADYVVDEARYLSASSSAALPVASPELAEPDKEGHSRYGRFLAPGEAHVDFRHLAGVVAELLVRPRLGVLEVVRLARQLPYGVTGQRPRTGTAHQHSVLDVRLGDPAAQS
ncbi:MULTISPECIES: hypothetical protein [unclassified Streptomyces]|uniref:hypothetical protein n=1 Tax=unclassified Streptomyces TaxID=2593676 RepID=UPI00093E53DB|nr:hypothetical protein [Streptomyces sp. TSRI0107]OKJ68881.1 hypothetical protein AMK31_37345 [Streptomyces sp. TSRI0107]